MKDTFITSRIWQLQNLNKWTRLVDEVYTSSIKKLLFQLDSFYQTIDYTPEPAVDAPETEVFDFYHNGLIRHLLKNKVNFPLSSCCTPLLVSKNAVFYDFGFIPTRGILFFNSVRLTDPKTNKIESRHNTEDKPTWIVQDPLDLLRGMANCVIPECLFRFQMYKRCHVKEETESEIKHYKRFSYLKDQLQEVCLPFSRIKRLALGKGLEPIEVDPPVRSCMVKDCMDLSLEICQKCYKCTDQHCECPKTASAVPVSTTITSSSLPPAQPVVVVPSAASQALNVINMITTEDKCPECKKPVSKTKVACEDLQRMINVSFCVDRCSLSTRCGHIRNCPQENCYRCLGCGHTKECIHYVPPVTLVHGIRCDGGDDKTDNDEDEMDVDEKLGIEPEDCCPRCGTHLEIGCECEEDKMDTKDEEDPEGNESADKCWVCNKDGVNTICVKCKDKAIDDKMCQDCLSMYRRLRPATCPKCGLCGECCPLDQPRCKCSPKCRRFVSCCLCQMHKCDKKTPRCIAE